MDCFIVTGMSGAGKSTAIKILEDMGLFCVDNLPLQLLPALARLHQEAGRPISRIAVGLDVRAGALFEEFNLSLKDLKKRNINYRALFLDAEDACLMNRFSETRRRHPLGKSVAAGIRQERKMLRGVRAMADQIVDTTNFTFGELKEYLATVLELRHPQGLAVAITSFGYKYGLPRDADTVFDVRFLTNPNYEPRLKHLTGLSPAVVKYVLKNSVVKMFLEHLEKLFDFLLPQYEREGKSYFTIGVGCTGGRHRSVAIANTIGKMLREKRGLEVKVMHRDIDK